MSKWSRKYINRLPDDAFLNISSGGQIDSTGRTKPRRLRHLPVRDAQGRVNARHLQNALARIPLTHISASAKAEARSKARKLLTASHILKEVDAELLKPYVARARRVA